jgi:hypothetical protein
MHFPQLPDVRGWNIKDIPQNILADDFTCTQSGPITNIHFWCSWKGDMQIPITNIHLSIHSDDRSGQYSKPGDLLWEYDTLGYFFSRLYEQGMQGWYDPIQHVVQYPDHQNCYQINIPIPLPFSFYQQAGTNYWLDIQVFLPPVGGFEFGWKTSVTNYEDAAVYGMRPPDPPIWIDRLLHPYTGSNLDLAFVIDGMAVTIPSVTQSCLVVWQPPDCAAGLDIPSWRFQPQPVINSFIVADDWLGDGRPITELRWWGSYKDWQNTIPTPVPPPIGAQHPIGFELVWWNDLPAGSLGSPYSTPSNAIATNYAEYSFIGNPTGQVAETYYCMTPLTNVGGTGFEHEYEYHVILTNPPPWQGLGKEDRIYWLSIQAIYTVGPQPTNVWGWKTTHPIHNWNDDATFASNMLKWIELRYPPITWDMLGNHPYRGQSVNMAFELYTDICPRRDKKWSQLPDMSFGQDMGSYWPTNDMQPNKWPLRADDFRSDGRRISDIHWWGSYKGWYSHFEDPVPPPSGFIAPLGFKLSWHGDIATNEQYTYSMPSNPPIKEFFVPIAKCHEMYFGPVWQWWYGQWEHEYQYYVNLFDPGIPSGPWDESENVIYWLNIQAVFTNGWQPGMQDPDHPGLYHYGWGWKTTSNQWNDVSVIATNSMAAGPMWTPGEYPSDHPLHGQPMDLAFELTTDKMRTNWPVSPIEFKYITHTNPAGIVGSLGDAGVGVQILQRATNLLGASVWFNVQTNPAPHGLPYTNWWLEVPISTNQYYRIQQTN